MAGTRGVVRVSDLDDPRLAVFTQLTDVALRSRREPRLGQYLAEGEKVVRRALAAGHQPTSLLLPERWLEPMADLVTELAEQVPIFVGGEEVLTELTGFQLHRGVIGAFRRPVLPDPVDLLAGGRLTVILEDIVDHTNVGAIFRCAAALGADSVLVSPQCADPFYRRSVRVSMGTVLQVPWTRLRQWPADLQLVRDQGYDVLALALGDQSTDLGDFRVDPFRSVALLFGTEGAGLTASAIRMSDRRVRIPMAHGVDSLNVAAAAAVAIWELRRQLRG
jgi:tRNA G18 (ribose-2'-O)-methylase SpoU